MVRIPLTLIMRGMRALHIDGSSNQLLNNILLFWWCKKSPINGRVKKGILRLSHYLTPEQGRLWVNLYELRDRLVHCHCGVLPSLMVDAVVTALRGCNKAESFFWTNGFNGTTHYISNKYTKNNQQPNIQRFKSRGGRQQRININLE